MCLWVLKQDVTISYILIRLKIILIQSFQSNFKHPQFLHPPFISELVAIDQSCTRTTPKLPSPTNKPSWQIQGTRARKRLPFVKNIRRASSNNESIALIPTLARPTPAYSSSGTGARASNSAPLSIIPAAIPLANAARISNRISPRPANKPAPQSNLYIHRHNRITGIHGRNRALIFSPPCPLASSGEANLRVPRAAGSGVYYDGEIENSYRGRELARSRLLSVLILSRRTGAAFVRCRAIN